MKGCVVVLCAALLCAGCEDLGIPELEAPDIDLPEVDLPDVSVPPLDLDVPDGVTVGRSLPDQELAIVRDKDPLFDVGYRLVSIRAHQPTDTVLLGTRGGQWGETRLMPGAYDIVVRVQEIGYVDWGEICSNGGPDFTRTFEASPGRIYQIEGTRSDGQCWMWIADVNSGRVVAGELPPGES